MMTSLQFLDAVRERHKLTSDYQLANYLGVTRQRVSQYRGGKTLGDETAIKVAAALELKPEHVLACIAAERTKDEKVRRAWQHAAAATAAGVIMFTLAVAVPDYWQAGEQSVSAVSDLYIMRSNAPPFSLYAALVVGLVMTMARAIVKNRIHRPRRR